MGEVASVLFWVGFALALLLALGWFLSYTAVRVDRLHHRMRATAAALDAQLVRRAEATLEAALSEELDPATSTLLAAAATEALESPGPWSAERAHAEGELTAVLRAADDSLPEGDPEDVLARLRKAAVRVQLARRFHNEAVADVLRLRHRPHTRWFRLAGRAPMPEPIELDDGWPRLDPRAVAPSDPPDQP